MRNTSSPSRSKNVNFLASNKISWIRSGMQGSSCRSDCNFHDERPPFLKRTATFIPDHGVLTQHSFASQSAFRGLKEFLSSKVLLAHCGRHPFNTLAADAPDWRCEFAPVSCPTPHPPKKKDVTHTSRATLHAKRNSSQISKEGLAVSFSPNMLQRIFRSHKSKLWTDLSRCYPVTYIRKRKTDLNAGPHHSPLVIWYLTASTESEFITRMPLPGNLTCH
ncbi:hypothetical protein CRM22_008183 [Opisthorchis felineus]|uniref:Uncharacterized protein n=1 Tax=Opisthorchis felineus TaxID=147828 RepID=A0A4S2LD10_OPIFE|nr:hypothetical protein CRM22_008183 [Opisthorchis felineus]TGZ61081.1 hypothetical protein CRM22_008183 [Opisthorchis felineus]